MLLCVCVQEMTTPKRVDTCRKDRLWWLFCILHTRIPTKQNQLRHACTHFSAWKRTLMHAYTHKHRNVGLVEPVPYKKPRKQGWTHTQTYTRSLTAWLSHKLGITLPHIPPIHRPRDENASAQSPLPYSLFDFLNSTHGKKGFGIRACVDLRLAVSHVLVSKYLHTYVYVRKQHWDRQRCFASHVMYNTVYIRKKKAQNMSLTTTCALMYTHTGHGSCIFDHFEAKKTQIGSIH
jgi:hypothetical protein